MGELNINSELVNRANSASHFNAGNTRAAEWEGRFREFDARFGDTDGLTEEQVEYLDERREQFRALVGEAANDNLSRRASWVPVTVAGPARYDSNKMGKRADAELKAAAEYDGKIDRFLNNTAKRLEAMTPIDIVLDRIRHGGLGYGEAIQSDDPYAIEKLEAKLEYLRESQEYMKAQNAYYRKHKTMKGFPDLSDEQAEKMDTEIKAGYHGTPNPHFMLSNNNATIKATEGRISKIKRSRERGSAEQEVGDGIRVVENTEIDRLQLIFPDIPPEETRALLKSNGFRWSPKNKAWQRQLTGNARYAAQRFFKEVGISAPEKQPPQVLPEAADHHD